MRIALAQINSVLGDFEANRKKIESYCVRAKERRCDLVVFPEASLFGYHPVDLLERKSIVDAQLKELKKLAKRIPEDLHVLIGAICNNPKKNGKPFLNAAVLLRKNKSPKIFAKELLPTYDVFDEGRHIEPGRLEKNRFRFKGKKILVTVCEDIWAWKLPNQEGSSYYTNPLKKLKPKDVDFVINLSASPFTDKKMKLRRHVTKQTAQYFRAPMVYVNMVGAQDEIIFDGGSFAVDEKGNVRANCIQFDEDLNVIDFGSNEGGYREEIKDIQEQRRQAIVLGIRDFANKTGLKTVHLGLSGGLDSALVACLAVDALGPEKVTCLALPGPYSTEKSLKLAAALAKNLGVNFHKLEISSTYEVVDKNFQAIFGNTPFGVINENIQARLRSLYLMAFSNKNNSLLLNTSNKSELATGYTTLYGDQAGGLCPIGDLLKTEVIALAKHYNKEWELIPEEIINRPPSAELRPDQKDTDSLPPYAVLDPIVEKLVENYKGTHTKEGQRILKMMMKSEFKRWQAAPILKVSDHAFGRGRRFPVAHKAIF